jgi:uncharacterized membrane protein
LDRGSHPLLILDQEYTHAVKSGTGCRAVLKSASGASARPQRPGTKVQPVTVTDQQPVTVTDRQPAPASAARPTRALVLNARRPELVAVAFFAIYALYSVRRHHRLETTGFDLGVFEQVVRSYVAGGMPVAPLKGPGFNALGDHFHPILALLAPVYRLVPAPETLLLAQSALIALSVVPIGRSAVRVLGPVGGCAVTIGYGLSWGLQEAVAFDFHEISFAVPLLAMSMNRLLVRRWGAAVAWAAPLVLVKEDLPLTVVAIGGYMFLRGQRRLGAATMLAGGLTGAVIVKVVLPALNPGGTYPYGGHLDPSLDGLDVKARTLVLLLAPTLFLALRSPMLVIALPTLAWRFLSDIPSHWGDASHYSAVLMPILSAALVDAVARRQRAESTWSTTVAVGCLAVSLALATDRPLWRLADPAFWHTDPAVAATHRVLDRIPDGAVVAATNGLAPQLTRRCEVRLLADTPPSEQTAEWIVADRRSPFFITPTELDRQLNTLKMIGYRVVVDDGRLALLQR